MTPSPGRPVLPRKYIPPRLSRLTKEDFRLQLYVGDIVSVCLDEELAAVIEERREALLQQERRQQLPAQAIQHRIQQPPAADTNTVIA